MSPLSLSYVRANLSALVRKASLGTPVPVAVRGKVAAWLVSAEAHTAAGRSRAPRLKGSLKLNKPVANSRADFLRWLDGEG